MAENSFKLKLISPTALYYKGRSSVITLSTKSGVVQILPHHADFLGYFEATSLHIKRDGGDEETFFLQKGFIRFSNKYNSCSITAHRVSKKSELSQIDYTQYLAYIKNLLDREETLDNYTVKFLRDEKVIIEKTLEEAKK
ncbi:hypothetical protein COV24_03110 [candidate division WWE3 bacterium CG10_big_fil_rev_8_21_14_0_10_32_10]|uniref:ATP synthase epsilon chain n=1 Tax=candidate division WWE3 bacterium CG10_big_fil_rev_8_21_14_0_10_32_10 TaxID=1975090 RepID=A0A2H0RA56_UNCKA|nr:MAG: hypothetical protein COV24_03110 [candidate division WWE3 bacterium CG10_big_fil_rev_8_21_14_0_10_32_10]